MFLILLWHFARRAASRAAWIAGNSNATKIPMIAITTNNSTSVKPSCAQDFRPRTPASGEPEQMLMNCLPVTNWHVGRRHERTATSLLEVLLSASAVNTQCDNGMHCLSG